MVQQKEKCGGELCCTVQAAVSKIEIGRLRSIWEKRKRSCTVCVHVGWEASVVANGRSIVLYLCGKGHGQRPLVGGAWEGGLDQDGAVVMGMDKMGRRLRASAIVDSRFQRGKAGCNWHGTAAMRPVAKTWWRRDSWRDFVGGWWNRQHSAQRARITWSSQHRIGALCRCERRKTSSLARAPCVIVADFKRTGHASVPRQPPRHTRHAPCALQFLEIACIQHRS
eukprot:IDg15749t1